MKIFIFSETPEAVGLRDKARLEGHQAFLRNPQYFKQEDFDASAELVYTDSAVIAEAFKAAGKLVSEFPWNVKAPKEAPKAEKAEEAPAPKPKTKAKPSASK